MKIILLTSRFPYPLDKGDRLRAYNILKQLSVSNEITLIALNRKAVPEHNFNEVKKFCKQIFVFRLTNVDLGINLLSSAFNGLPFQVGIFFKKSFKSKIQNIIKKIKPDAVFCHLIRMSEYIKDMNGSPKTLDYMDAFSNGMKRRADISGNILANRFFLNEYGRLARYENKIFDKFEKKIIISEQDKDLIPHDEKEKIVIIPNGVDTEIFHPLEREKKYDLLFTGNMGYPPNIESAIYTVKKIMPLFSNEHPSVKLLIAGINPPRELQKLQSENVDVIPKFSHIREAFAQSKIMLAPMFISIGLQNKILQAMAMKIPCVCSSLANNAIKAPVNDCILEANSPEEFRNCIMLLLNDRSLYKRISDNAYDFVLSNYNWKSINTKLEEHIF